MSPDEAKKIIAQDAVARLIAYIPEDNLVEWEDYEFIGESDWDETVGVMMEEFSPGEPSPADLEEAERVLTARTEII